MRFFEYLLNLAYDADPLKSGFQARPMYLLFTIAIPILLGVLLGSLLKILERMARRKIRRGE